METKPTKKCISDSLISAAEKNMKIIKNTNLKNKLIQYKECFDCLLRFFESNINLLRTSILYKLLGLFVLQVHFLSDGIS